MADFQINATGGRGEKSETPTWKSVVHAEGWLPGPSVPEARSPPSWRHRCARDAVSPLGNTIRHIAPVSLMPGPLMAWWVGRSAIPRVPLDRGEYRPDRGTADHCPLGVYRLRKATPPRSASGCMPVSERQMNAWEVRKSLLKAKPTMVPVWLMPFASAFGSPLSVPS